MSVSRFDLSGRHAVVVGGTSGIGRAIALGLADAGANVAATVRGQGLVDEVVEPQELLDRAVAVAEQMLAIPAPAFELTKHQLRWPVMRRSPSLARSTSWSSRRA